VVKPLILMLHFRIMTDELLMLSRLLLVLLRQDLLLIIAFTLVKLSMWNLRQTLLFPLPQARLLLLRVLLTLMLSSFLPTVDFCHLLLEAAPELVKPHPRQLALIHGVTLLLLPLPLLEHHPLASSIKLQKWRSFIGGSKEDRCQWHGKKEFIHTGF